MEKKVTCLEIVRNQEMKTIEVAEEAGEGVVAVISDRRVSIVMNQCKTQQEEQVGVLQIMMMLEQVGAPLPEPQIGTQLHLSKLP